MPPSNGIVHTADGQPVYLPLEQVKASVIILDVSARVTLTQTYSNTSDKATSRAKYVFPVPASAAVCAFEMRTPDGRIVTGVCKEKNQAREEYERAIRDGKFAANLEFVTDDIFTISVGSIPARQIVVTKLVYVVTLMDNDYVDEVRFHLPMCVGERYGPPHPELATAAAPSPNTRIRITTEVQTNGPIKSITSPTHSSEITTTPYPTDFNRPSRRRSTVKFRSKSFLDKDFVLIISAQGLDVPRCFAELERDPNGGAPDTVALQLTIIPKFNLMPIPAQEYIFVVDRSGSMYDDRIETAKSTLLLLLRMLPNAGTTFNIVSFGDHHSSLWPQSMPYTQGTLDTATHHVDTMSANYGGTEICEALRAVFRSRTTHMPTAVFVLTDGQVSNPPETVAAVHQAVSAAPPTSPIRVFTLGIGAEVSTDLCESIARVGNGVCLFAVTTESIIGKCARLFRAGRTPFVENVSIDWGIPEVSASASVNFSSQPTTSGGVHLRPPPLVQQSPPHIESIHSGARFNVFVILTIRNAVLPKEVTLRGNLDGGSDPFELTVPIKGANLGHSGAFIHTLAAWRLVQDLEEGRAALPQVVGTSVVTNEELKKAAIVRLGERYQIVSSHTSFVAVDNGQDDAPSRSDARRQRRRSSASPSSRGGDRRGASSTASVGTSSQTGTGILSVMSSIFSGLFGYASGNTSTTTTPPVPAPARRNVPGAWSDSAPSSRSSSPAPPSDYDDGYESSDTLSSLSSLEESSEWSEDTSTPPPSPRSRPRPLSDVDAVQQRSPSPQFEPIDLAPPAMKVQHVPPPPPHVPPPPPIEGAVVELVRLQSFDGSFYADLGLRNIVGDQALQAEAGVDERVWATAVAVAFMQKHMASAELKELLDDLLVKAMLFLKDANTGMSDADILRLVDRAKGRVS